MAVSFNVPFSLLAAACLFAAGCSTNTPSQGATLSPQAQQWLDRARDSYKKGDVDDARDSAKSALIAAPTSVEVKISAARIHLARLEYDEAIRVLEGVESSDARALRGRAKWYKGQIDEAADELEALLTDPQVKDEWARTISKLARRGSGRKPFQIGEGLLAPVTMIPGRGTPHLVVPIEIDGEPALAVVATNKTEVILDSNSRREPAWVQLRFGERITVSNVPALTEDLSGISKELNAPIKALLGVNLLRRMYVTFDLLGAQFVVRTKEPPPPPKATRIGLSYAMGGAMLARVSLRAQSDATSPMLVNTLLPFPVALDELGWKSAGIDLNTLQAAPGFVRDAKLRGTTLPMLRLGAFDIAGVPAFFGPNFADARTATGIEIEGAIGAGLLARYRCTLAAEGRAMWLEDFPEDDPFLTAPPPMSPPPPVAPEQGGIKPTPPPAAPPPGK